MKLLFFCICTLLLTTPVFSVGFRPFVIRSCVRQTRIKSVDLALFYGTLFDTVSKSTKCYLTCLYEGTGFIVKGEVNKDLIDMADESQGADSKNAHLFGIIEACKDVKVAGECEEGLAVFQCMLEYGKKSIESPEEYSEEK